MNFAKHSNLEGQHAYLGASKFHWLNYSDDKIEETYRNFLAVQMGTRLHELASEMIKLGIKLPKSNKTLNLFVNDAIGYKMNSEQVLYYSPNCFGTADAISFRNNTLRIHDLKTGKIPAHFEQLEIYAALFCLEYDFKPHDMTAIILQIYQNNEIIPLEADPDVIVHIMDRIKVADKILSKIQAEEI